VTVAGVGTTQLWLCGGEGIGNIETVSSGNGRRMGNGRADAGGVIIRCRLVGFGMRSGLFNGFGWVWYELIRSGSAAGHGLVSSPF